jgi:hypothetical protein
MGPKKKEEKMRRMALLLGMMTLLIIVAAGVAWAVTKTCGSNPCTGTASEDVLYERVGRGVPDSIYGLENRDFIDANTFNRDTDKLWGGRGADKLLSNDGDGRDVVRGGQGRDVCIIDRGDGRVGCEDVRIRSTVGDDGSSGGGGGGGGGGGY